MILFMSPWLTSLHSFNDWQVGILCYALTMATMPYGR